MKEKKKQRMYGIKKYQLQINVIKKQNDSRQ